MCEHNIILKKIPNHRYKGGDTKISDSACANCSNDDSCRTSSGKVFHETIVAGNNKYL